MKDPVVEEIRQARDAHAKQFNCNPDAISEDLREREKDSAVPTVILYNGMQIRIRPMEERILGYDVREMWHKVPWDFHMGSKLVKMLTADVWSSILDYGSYPNVVGKDRERLGEGMIELPPIVPCFGTSYPVWSNLADLLNYLSPYRCAEGKPYWVVAITLRTVDLERERLYIAGEDWPCDPQANPDSVQSDWVLVGYDLGSGWALSRITQYLIPEEAEAQDISELARELNQYGLFPTIEKAGEFGMRWDTDFPEDAPHVVYGIWRIEETRYRPR